jgi:hypothetical protein
MSMIVVKTKSWEQARTLGASLSAKWVFRGQSDASWCLTSRFERECEKLNRFDHTWLYLERQMLRQFKRGAHHYIRDLPLENDHLSWLALMQHYGAPTRLLDFTHSFYVAAFFTMEARPQNKTKEAAIWALNSFVLDARAKAKKEMLAKLDGLEVRFDGEKRREFVNNCIDNNIAERPNERFVLAVEPHRLDERIRAQQGLFIFPCEISAPFRENFGSALDLAAPDAEPLPEDYTEELHNRCSQDESLDTLKILLPYQVPYSDGRAQYSEAYTIMSDLKKMNITPEVLFPGLDGFAKSMAYHLRHFGELPRS